MSVQHESLDIKAQDRKPEAPELEYKAASQDSLSMFFAAIGGAVLGMLATLLILALINGGTLNFIHPERLAVIEQNLTRVNENVGAVSTNVDNVAQQVTAMRSDLDSARGDVQAAMTQLDEHGTTFETIGTDVEDLKVTGQRFDTFVVALGEALNSMDRVGATNGVTAAPIAGAGASAPVVVNSDAVAAGNVAVLFFADADGNGRMDDSEANLVGLQLSVTDAQGETVGDYSSTDAGILVENLSAGQYTFQVTDAGDHSLSGADSVTVNVAQDGAEGQIVYIAVAE
jgi:outer membrane murein-binding lipoprotein Lpp